MNEWLGLEIVYWVHRLLTVMVVVVAANAEEIRVAGHVIDKTSTPISGARIILTSASLGSTFEAESDPTGAFMVQLPAIAQYTLTVDKQGFYLHRTDSLQIDRSPFELSVILEGIHELRSSVDVVATRGTFDMERTAQQNTLSSRSLFDIPFPNQNNLRSGLRMLPGLVQDSRGGIHLYGSAEEQTHHNFEGFQLNDPLTGKLEARMSLEAIESVDAAPGQPGAEFGRGVGGTLSIHARKGDDEFRYSATNLFPSIDTQRGTTLGSWTPRGNVSGPWYRGRAWFFNTLELQYINSLVPELPGGQNRSRSYRANDLLHNQFNLTPSNLLTVGLLFNYWYAPRNGLTFLDPRETTVDRRSRQWFGYVKDQKSFARGALLEVGYAASRTFSRETPQGHSRYIVSELGRRGNYYANAQRQATRDQVILNTYLPTLTFAGIHHFKIGGDFLNLGYEQTVRRTGIEFQGADGHPVRALTFYGTGMLRHSNQEGSFYIQDSWRPRPNLLLDTGFRIERNHILQNWNLSPRVGFAWALPGSESTRVSGGFARTFDNTNLRTFTRPFDQFLASVRYDQSGNPSLPALSIYQPPGVHLRSPRSINWNLGIERTLPRRILGRVQLLGRNGTAGFSYVDTVSEPQRISGLVNFQGDPAPQFDAVYRLTNRRHDTYKSIEFAVQQPLGAEHEWMASYTRSSTRSNGVIDRNIDEPLIVSNNAGPLPWDAPNRMLSWGFLPTLWKDWSIAYLLEWRSGFPFSIQEEHGGLVGAVDDHRFPQFFELDLFAERRLTIRGYRLGIRGGVLNITAHRNPNVVNNIVGSPSFLQMFGGQQRAVNFRLRFFGRT